MTANAMQASMPRRTRGATGRSRPMMTRERPARSRQLTPYTDAERLRQPRRKAGGSNHFADTEAAKEARLGSTAPRGRPPLARRPQQDGHDHNCKASTVAHPGPACSASGLWGIGWAGISRNIHLPGTVASRGCDVPTSYRVTIALEPPWQSARSRKARIRHL